MAWTAPMTFTDGTPLTGAQLNTFLRDNLLETAPAKAQTPGSIFVTTDVNQISERRISSHEVLTNESTGSTSYTDLTTPGPTVTTVTGSQALVIFQCGMTPAGGNLSRMSVEVSGATSISPSDNWSLRLTNSGGSMNASAFAWFNTLSPGSNTFQAKYMVSSSSSNFFQRRMMVLPL